MNRAIRCGLGLVLMAWAITAWSHARSVSYAHWQLQPDGGAVSARVSQLDLSRLGLDPRSTADYPQRVADQVSADLQLWSAGGRCTAGPVQASADDAGWMRLRWSVQCSGQPLSIRTRLLEAVAPSHLHIVNVETVEGGVLQRVLGFADPEVRVADDGTDAPVAGLLPFLKVGIGHILSGADHLVFVLLLLMLATRLGEVVALASAFTVAHSLTLAAAALGLVQVQGAWVEALIGLSIVLVAAEHLWQRAGRDPGVPVLTLMALLLSGLVLWPRLPLSMLAGLLLFTACYFGLLAYSPRPLRLRLLLAFGFGLVHGFGFAGEMLQIALPREALVVALLGFNLGVELGQLLVIALAWPLLRLLDRLPRAGGALRHALGISALAIGSYWWMVRVGY